MASTLVFFFFNKPNLSPTVSWAMRQFYGSELWWKATKAQDICIGWRKALSRIGNSRNTLCLSFLYPVPRHSPSQKPSIFTYKHQILYVLKCC